MTQTLIGFDSTNTACVKITTDAYDPVTTPDSTPGAFLFNSKDAVQTRIISVDVTGDSNPAVLPTGADASNFSRWIYNYSTSSGWNYRAYFYQNSFFSGLDYDIPVTDFIAKSTIDGWYVSGGQYSYDYSSQNQNSNVGYVSNYFPGGLRSGDAGWRKDYRVNVNGDLGWQNGVSYYARLLHFLNTNTINEGAGTGRLPVRTYYDMVAWNLPAENIPLPTPAPSVPGLNAIQINSSGFKIAKPGFDVRTATDSQLALSSTVRAAKIVAADDIAIPAGYSEYNIGIDIPSNSVANIYYYTGNEIVWPTIPRITPVGAKWRIVGNVIQFQNNGIACRARFVVIVNDFVPQTVGNNNVLRQIEVNGKNVVQFLKPGAADVPAFSDIILDSRWPAVRLIKDGWLDVQPGTQVYNVPIQAEGYFPFVKMMVTCNGRTQTSGTATVESYSAVVRPPTVSMTRLTNTWAETGETTYARITANNVAFHTFRGAPRFYFWIYNSSSGWRLSTYYADEVIGIRYYIFGIPPK